MDRRNIKINLDKLNSTYFINAGVTREDIAEAESKLGLEFPKEVVSLYQSFNGLSVEKPMLKIHCIKDLANSAGLIEFAVFNGSEPVAFNSSKINQAGQWSIVNADTGFEITLTLASFLTNKVWAWLHRGREIWAEETYM